MSSPVVLLVSNFEHSIKGRDYGSEDVLLAEELRRRGFVIELILPETLLPLNSDVPLAKQILRSADAVLFRNNYGGVLEKDYREAVANFASADGAKIFNDFEGAKGDYCGKQHLLDLFTAGYPVIPSSRCLNDLTRPEFASSAYMIKSMTGADSNGIKGHLSIEQTRAEFTRLESLRAPQYEKYLIQPMVDFVYEVSFYFFEDQFMYAVYNGGTTPGITDDLLDESAKRWTLQVYDPTDADLKFAQTFVDWNNCTRQIQRIDACRLSSGALLLMEIEDYNCWLSLGDLAAQRPKLLQQFVDRLASCLFDFVSSSGIVRRRSRRQKLLRNMMLTAVSVFVLFGANWGA